MRLIPGFLFVCISFSFCTGTVNETGDPVDEGTRRQQEIAANLARLKSTARDGDLVVRLNDDMISEQLRYFNEVDKSFSHSGIIVTKNGKKTVCSILPGISGPSPVVYTPIDSFLNPALNSLCGLFRYNLPAPEMAAFVKGIDAHASRPVYFDSLINIATDDSLYCSEMIYKTMKQVTNGRVSFKLNTVPRKMQPTLYLFYRGRLTRDEIARREVVFIDALYNVPECTELMRFKLKYFPGT